MDAHSNSRIKIPVQPLKQILGCTIQGLHYIAHQHLPAAACTLVQLELDHLEHVTAAQVAALHLELQELVPRRFQFHGIRV